MADFIFISFKSLNRLILPSVSQYSFVSTVIFQSSHKPEFFLLIFLRNLFVVTLVWSISTEVAKHKDPLKSFLDT